MDRMSRTAGRAARDKQAARLPPHLPAELSPGDRVVLEPDAEVQGISITGIETDGDAVGVEVSACRLVGVALVGLDLSHARITDVSFERCDLSAATLVEASLLRTEFVDCRLNGAVLSGARLVHVGFRDCRMSGLELRMATAEQLELTACDLAGADFYGSSLVGAAMTECNLTGADCSRATWTAARLHGSTLIDLRGAADLAGARIGSEQAVGVGLQLLAAVGITIDDEAEAP